MQIDNDTLLALVQIGLTVTEVVIGFIFVRLFLYLFEVKLETRFRKRITLLGRGITYVALMSFLLISLFIGGVQDRFWWLLAGTVALFLYSLIFCEGKILNKVFWLFIAIVFFAASQLAGDILTLLITEKEHGFTQYEGVMNALFSLALFGLFIFLLGSQKKRELEMSSFAIFILSIIPMFSCYILYVWFYLDAWDAHAQTLTEPNELLRILELTTVLSIAAINIVTFILYDYMLNRSRKLFEQQGLLQQAELTQIHNEELQSLYRETRAWRHDYGNHLQAIEAFARDDQNEALQKYVGELKGSLDKINSRINSGNELVDAILNTKMSYAEEKNIAFEVDINASVGDIPLTLLDSTSLVGNLVDNAIEACQRISDPLLERRIVLSISRTKDQLIIYIENTTENSPVINGKDEFVSSKKEGDHGIGTKQINEVVKKYGGQIDRVIEKNSFETLITLPLKISKR